MTSLSMARAAKKLLYQASRRLGTADPREDVDEVIEESLDFPIDNAPRSRHGLLEPNFSETSPETLAFTVSGGGPRLSPADRIETASKAMAKTVGRRFGNGALHWLEGRMEEAAGRDHGHSASWGASFGSSFDRNGVRESAVHYEWGPLLMDALPKPLYRLTRAAIDTVPGLRPAVSSIRCGRRSGSQQVTFEVDRALALMGLQPLMDRLGLGHRHTSLMSAAGFILGARFTLPPETAALTLRPTRQGVEMRLDVMLDELPDPPAQLMALMRLQMTERPRGLRALDRWLMALTPDGLPGPGTVSVLSIWVRPDMPARLALYLRPAALEKPVARKAPAKPSPPKVRKKKKAAQAAWAP